MTSLKDIIGPEPFKRRYLTCRFTEGNDFTVKFPHEFVRSKRRKFVKVHRVSMFQLFVETDEIGSLTSLANLHATFNEDGEDNNFLICNVDGNPVNKYYEIISNRPTFNAFFSYHFSDKFQKIYMGRFHNQHNDDMGYEAILELELFY